MQTILLPVLSLGVTLGLRTWLKPPFEEVCDGAAVPRGVVLAFRDLGLVGGFFLCPPGDRDPDWGLSVALLDGERDEILDNLAVSPGTPTWRYLQFGMLQTPVFR